MLIILTNGFFFLSSEVTEDGKKSALPTDLIISINDHLSDTTI